MSSFDFDCTYSAVTGEPAPTAPYVPSVEHSDAHDVMIDGTPWRDLVGTPGAWLPLTGYTGQYGYRGAVMHPSETVSDAMLRQWVTESGGDTFAIVECRDDSGDYPDGDPIGWVVLYRADETGTL